MLLFLICLHVTASAEVIERQDARSRILSARAVFSARIESIYKTKIIKASPCFVSGEKYTARIKVDRVIIGKAIDGYLCFDNPPTLDQTVLVAVGSEKYPRWVRGFWPILRNVREDRPHIRIDPDDGLDRLATTYVMNEELCIDMACKSVDYYRYVLYSDVSKAILALKLQRVES